MEHSCAKGLPDPRQGREEEEEEEKEKESRLYSVGRLRP